MMEGSLHMQTHNDCQKIMDGEGWEWMMEGSLHMQTHMHMTRLKLQGSWGVFERGRAVAGLGDGQRLSLIHI